MFAFETEADALDAFSRGAIDLLGLNAAPTDPALSAQALERPGASFWFIAFDMQKADSPSASSQLLRRALALAVDREELNRAVGFSGPVAGSPIPPGVPGHDPSLVSAYDPEEARTTLARALDQLGLEGPEALHLSFVHGTRVGDGPQYLERQWRTELGISVDFVGLEPDEYFERLRSGHDFDLFWLQWYADFPHPVSYLEPLWRCDSPSNLQGYCNPDVDALLDRAAGEDQTDAQLEAYAAAQRELVADEASIFLQWPSGSALVAPRIQGLTLTPMDDFPGSIMVNQIHIGPP